MGIVRMGPPEELIEELATEFGIANFVETGTYYAGTAVWASQHFKNVFTIEYSEELYKNAVQNYKEITNIEFIFGDSRTEIRKIIDRLEGSSVYWLDAHWSGGETYGEHDESPVVEEINILNHSKFDDFIFVDDARLFLSPPPRPHKITEWPDIQTVINALAAGKSIKYIVIIEDVIIAVPIFAKALVTQYCQKVNTEAWEERGRQLRTSNLKKGMSLIWYDLKQRLRFLMKRF